MNLLNILTGITVIIAAVCAAFAFIYDEWFGAGAVFLFVVAHQIYLIGKRRRDAKAQEAAEAWQEKV